MSAAQQHAAQRVDDLATRLLALVEEVIPVASPDGRIGAEALLAALIRRLGPIDYASFSAAMVVRAGVY